MALTHILSVDFEKGEEIIPIPKTANCCRLRRRKVLFFKFNPTLPKDTREIPDNASSMNFEGYREYCFWVNYGRIIFYDSRGRIINNKG